MLAWVRRIHGFFFLAQGATCSCPCPTQTLPVLLSQTVVGCTAVGRVVARLSAEFHLRCGLDARRDCRAARSICCWLLKFGSAPRTRGLRTSRICHQTVHCLRRVAPNSTTAPARKSHLPGSSLPTSPSILLPAPREARRKASTTSCPMCRPWRETAVPQLV